MKNMAILTVWITTLLLLVLTILSFSTIGFNWMFYLTIVGQVLVVFMVYKVLKDVFTTEKTFDTHFYQDSDIKRIE